MKGVLHTLKQRVNGKEGEEETPEGEQSAHKSHESRAPVSQGVSLSQPFLCLLILCHHSRPQVT